MSVKHEAIAGYETVSSLQDCMHVLGGPFEELACSCEEDAVASKKTGLVATHKLEHRVVRRVAGRDKCSNRCAV